jgi:hypothetical protein
MAAARPIVGDGMGNLRRRRDHRLAPFPAAHDLKFDELAVTTAASVCSFFLQPSSVRAQQPRRSDYGLGIPIHPSQNLARDPVNL